MRRWIAVVVLSLCTSVLVAGQQPTPDQPQDQPEDNARKILERIPPAYPELARRMNLAGLVRLRVTVAADGAAKGTEVLGRMTQ